MQRRQALCTVLGGIGLFSGCLTQAKSAIQGDDFKIEYRGDQQPNEQRIIMVVLTKPSTGSIFNGTTDDSVRLTDETGVFYEKYEVKPGTTLHPQVYASTPGKYILKVWVENRGTMGGPVQISKDGSLADPGTIVITADGIRSM